ncbi:MAG: WD40 repeat domain-containing protein [Candidatus Omnitrophica bacterium]|nr:WD40 repeat domain-containing protein [Candidatus Omnitrophota bacterium]
MNIGPSYSLKFAPDGNRLAVIAKAILLIDIKENKSIFSVKSLKDPSSAVFSPNGEMLLVKNTKGSIVFLSSRDGSSIHKSEKGISEGSVPLFSKCGNYVIDGSWNGDLRVRNVTSGDCEWCHKFSEEMIEGVHNLEKDLKWLVIHGMHAPTDNDSPPPPYLSIWDYPIPKEEPIRVVRPALPFISASTPSPDGQLLVVVYGAPPSKLAIIDLKNGSVLCDVNIKSGGCGSAVSWSMSGLIASVQQERIEIYKADSLNHIGGIDVPDASDVDWSPQGDLLAIGSWKNGRIIKAEDIPLEGC